MKNAVSHCMEHLVEIPYTCKIAKMQNGEFDTYVYFT